MIVFGILRYFVAWLWSNGGCGVMVMIVFGFCDTSSFGYGVMVTSFFRFCHRLVVSNGYDCLQFLRYIVVWLWSNGYEFLQLLSSLKVAFSTPFIWYILFHALLRLHLLTFRRRRCFQTFHCELVSFHPVFCFSRRPSYFGLFSFTVASVAVSRLSNQP